MEELFQSLKYSCHNLEKIRQQIYRLSHSELETSLILTGSGYDLKGRLHYFEVAEQQEEVKSLQSINDELNILRENNNDNTANMLIEKIIEFCEQYKSKYGEDLLEISDNIDNLEYKKWGRQRVIFLIIGYLILRSSENFYLIICNIHNNISSIFTWCIDSKGLNISDSVTFFTKYIVTRRIFELIQERDLFSYETSRHEDDEGYFIFNDPVVPYRLASSKYLNEDFNGAANVMYRYFEEKNNYGSTFDWNNNRMTVPKLTNFYLRWGQYIWLSCDLDNSKIEDNIDNIFDKLSNAIEHEHNKTTCEAISWYIIIYYYSLYFNILGIHNKYSSNVDILISRIQSFSHSDSNYIYIGKSICDVFLAIKNKNWSQVNPLKRVANNAILARANRHPGAAINQYNKILESISQIFIEQLSNSEQNAHKKIVFISYDEADRNIVTMILASLYPRFLNTYFWDYKDNYAYKSLLNSIDAPFKYSVATILFSSENYIINEDLIVEKRMIAGRKIKEEDAYPIIPILIGINSDDFNQYLFSEFDLSPLEYSIDFHEQAILDIETCLKNLYLD